MNGWSYKKSVLFLVLGASTILAASVAKSQTYTDSHGNTYYNGETFQDENGNTYTAIVTSDGQFRLQSTVHYSTSTAVKAEPVPLAPTNPPAKTQPGSNADNSLSAPAVNRRTKGGLSEACSEALADANNKCSPNNAAAQSLGAVQNQAGAGMGTDAYSRCMAMRVQGLAAHSGTLYLMNACMGAAQSCVSACSTLNSDSSALNTCTGLKSQAKYGGVATMVMTGMTATQMGSCANIIKATQAGLCGPGSTNPMCSFPSTGGGGLSGVPAGAGLGSTGGGFPSGVPGVPNDPAGVGGADMNGNMYGGNPPGKPQGPDAGLANDQASTGGGLMSAGAYPGGAGGNNNGGGQGGGGFNTDIGGGLSNGGGYAVSGAAAENYGSREFGITYGGGGDKLDLSRFLPGRDLDPSKRGPASVDSGLFSQGVTGANDLSNFEKVTRVMNRKRPFLLP